VSLRKSVHPVDQWLAAWPELPPEAVPIVPAMLSLVENQTFRCTNTLLADEAGVSRGTVRAGLKSLIIARMIARVRNHGDGPDHLGFMPGAYRLVIPRRVGGQS
jgi:hypothetical protein